MTDIVFPIYLILQASTTRKSHILGLTLHVYLPRKALQLCSLNKTLFPLKLQLSYIKIFFHCLFFIQWCGWLPHHCGTNYWHKTSKNLILNYYSDLNRKQIKKNAEYGAKFNQIIIGNLQSYCKV